MQAKPMGFLLLLGMLAGFGSFVLAQEEMLPTEEEESIGAIEESPEAEDASNSGSRTQVQKEHTVVTGDTLWDLCATYLNNSWYWPRIWSYNPELSNPHWIYPGQVVRFYPGGELPSEILVSDEMEVPEMVPEEPEEELVTFASGKDIIRAKEVSAVMLRRDSFVTPEELKEMGTIKGSREEKQYLSEYDPIYIEFNDPSAAQVGQQYMIVRTMKELYHPISGDFVGYYTRVLGTTQVLQVDRGIATGIIATSLDSIHRGDRIVPVMPEMKKRVTPRKNTVELQGHIVDSRVGLSVLGERHIVFIDRGTNHGVQEGNVFDCVRRRDGLVALGDDEDVEAWDQDLPIEIFGRILVVDARPSASTGMVMASLREMHAGDRVHMSMR